MSYIYKLLPTGQHEGQDPDNLLRAVREVEILGDPTDLIALSFKPESSAIGYNEIARREDWRDLPVGQRTRLYITEGKQVIFSIKGRDRCHGCRNLA